MTLEAQLAEIERSIFQLEARRIEIVNTMTFGAKNQAPTRRVRRMRGTPNVIMFPTMPAAVVTRQAVQ